MMKIRYLKPAMLGETLSGVVAAPAIASTTEPRTPKAARRPARSANGARASTKQPHAPIPK